MNPSRERARRPRSIPQMNMVKASYYHKPYRKSLIQAYGATIFASPSEQTNAGRKVLAEAPDSPGSLGIAISEAVEDAATHDDAHYSLGSVLNHVPLHQTVIGQESMMQMEIAGEYPDVVIGCIGGGSFGSSGSMVSHRSSGTSGADKWPQIMPTPWVLQHAVSEA